MTTTTTTTTTISTIECDYFCRYQMTTRVNWMEFKSAIPIEYMKPLTFDELHNLTSILNRTYDMPNWIDIHQPNARTLKSIVDEHKIIQIMDTTRVNVGHYVYSFRNFYYDPFGIVPPKPIVDSLPNEISFDSVGNQSINASLCGPYCLYVMFCANQLQKSNPTTKFDTKFYQF